MPDKPFDEDLTPVETPNAKKISGQWHFNVPSTPCARDVCGCPRDEHVRDASGVFHECMSCGKCPGFVAGGQAT